MARLITAMTRTRNVTRDTGIHPILNGPPDPSKTRNFPKNFLFQEQLVNKVQSSRLSMRQLKMHRAANKAMVAAVLRSYIIQNDIDGLAEHYDSLRETSAGGEKTMFNRFICSGMHATRQHKELIGNWSAF